MSASSKHRIYFQLQEVSHRLKKRADQLAMESGGVTTAQAAVLNIIIQEGSASQATVAKRLSQRESAITTMAARLESAGYITKQKSEVDRRNWVLKATRKGHAAMKKMTASLSEVNALLDGAVSQKRIDEMAKSLHAISKALEEEG